MKGKLLHYTMGRNSWQDPSRTIFSATRERRGVTEIGLYSESVLGLATLGEQEFLPFVATASAAGKGQIQNIMCNHMGNLIRAVVIKPPGYVIEAW